MNRFNAPWLALPWILFGAYVVAHLSVLILSIADGTTYASAIYVLGIVGMCCAIGSIFTYAGVLSFYDKSRLYTSTVTKVWMVRSGDKTADYATLLATTDVSIKYGLKLSASSRATYWIQNVDSHSNIKPGALVTLKRRVTGLGLVFGGEWNATVISVTPPEEFAPGDTLV